MIVFLILRIFLVHFPQFNPQKSQSKHNALTTHACMRRKGSGPIKQKNQDEVFSRQAKNSHNHPKWENINILRIF